MLQYLLEHDDGPTVGRIAKWVRISDSHASHLLAQLTARQCVECTVDAVDRRCRLYELTPEGRAIAIAWREHVRAALGARIWRRPAATQEAIAETIAERCLRLRSVEYY